MFRKDYSTYYDTFNSEKPYKEEIKFLYDWAGRPKEIIDLGCGTSSYWKFFPLYVHLFGVEKSKDMIREKNVVCADITRYKTKLRFECAISLFDVMNYIPKHNWWKNIPINPGGLFIFDIWDKNKIQKDGFKKTRRISAGIKRIICPVFWNDKYVDLRINFIVGQKDFTEFHRMYLYSHKDIEKFCGNEFEIMETKETDSWQKWYKCRKK